ncbi:MAG: c-type cytochrome domain-containing protein, partial [Verrucomicrobiota bacterium]
MRIWKPALCAALASISVSYSNAFDRSELESFLDAHCYDCHDDLVSEGELNLLDLDFEESDPLNLEQWVHVLDRVESGEMPPTENGLSDPQIRILRDWINRGATWPDPPLDVDALEFP